MGVVAVWAVEVPSQTSSLTDGLIAAEIERMPRAPQRRRADAANQSGGLPWIGAQGNRPCCTAYAAAPPQVVIDYAREHDEGLDSYPTFVAGFTRDLTEGAVR